MTSRISDNQKQIEEIARTACVALFACYDLDLGANCEQGTSTEAQYVGVIGFTGDNMRGTLLIAMTDRTLAQSLPETSEPRDSANRDWISELSNQLLGRIKNSLLRRETAIYLSMPLVLRGEHLSPLPRQFCQHICFNTPTGQIQIWVDTEFADDYVLPTEDIEGGEEVPSEGEALLF